MSTVEAGELQGDKVSAIQKRHMVESDTSEHKRHSRLSRIDDFEPCYIEYAA